MSFLDRNDAQERSGSDLGAIFDLLGLHLVFGAVLDPQKESLEAPGTLKIKVFVWTVCKN